MNIAVISDIHGNLAALEAVAADLARWQPAVVIVAGDLVNRGPQPLECLAFCFAREREDGWRLLRGNHEEYVLSILADPSARAGAEEAVRENVRWTAARVGDVAPIRALPTQISLAGPDGGEVRIVHASMRHDRDNILADTPDEELRAKIAPAPPVFCCGHTHRPFVRRLDSTLVVNAGAVGLPFDGDPRSSYARLSWDGGGWQAEIVRVSYRREQTAQAYQESGFLSQGGPIAPLIFREFELAQPKLSTWFNRYKAGLLAGQITAAQSVAEFLTDV